MNTPEGQPKPNDIKSETTHEQDPLDLLPEVTRQGIRDTIQNFTFIDDDLNPNRRLLPLKEAHQNLRENITNAITAGNLKESWVHPEIPFAREMQNQGFINEEQIATVEANARLLLTLLPFLKDTQITSDEQIYNHMQQALLVAAQDSRYPINRLPIKDWENITPEQMRIVALRTFARTIAKSTSGNPTHTMVEAPFRPLSGKPPEPTAELFMPEKKILPMRISEIGPQSPFIAAAIEQAGIGQSMADEFHTFKEAADKELDDLLSDLYGE